MATPIEQPTTTPIEQPTTTTSCVFFRPSQQQSRHNHDCQQYKQKYHYYCSHPRLLLLFMSSTFSETKPTKHDGFESDSVKSLQQQQLLRSSNSNKQTKPSHSNIVVYQKVVKPSSSTTTNEPSNILFLGYLIEYLQDIFTLPNNLPMVYNKQLPPDEDNDDDNDDDTNNIRATTMRNGNTKEDDNEVDRAILWWDSPLTPNPDATRLSVEVIGIYSNNNNQQQQGSSSAISTAPDMAMVVVRKKGPNNSNQKQQPQPLPLMMKNLFEDSEKRIFRALDMGLDDFMAGRVNFPSHPYNKDQKQARHRRAIRTLEEALQAERMMEEDNAIVKAEEDDDDQIARNVMDSTSRDLGNKVIDTTATLVSSSPPPPQQHQQQNKPSRKRPGKASLSSTPSTPDQDYAIRAAKKAAVLRSMQQQQRPALSSTATSDGKTEDYAVNAARERNQKQQQQQSSPTPSFDANDDNLQIPRSTTTSSQHSVSDANDKFEQPLANHGRKRKNKKPEPENSTSRTSSPSSTKLEPDVLNQVNAEEHLRSAKGRRLNVAYHDETTSDPTKEDNLVYVSKEESTTATVEVALDTDSTTNAQSHNNDISTTSSTTPPQLNEIDIATAARQALTEMAELGSDMSAEEMLQDVLKFGEQQDKENTAGNGFVSGALEMAKELLRERTRQRQEKMQANVKVMDKTSPFQINIGDAQDDKNQPRTTTTKLSAEEELRQMFEAGERLADGRISLVTSTGTTSNSLDGTRVGTDDDQIVDDLIADETSVSNYARILDDELAELEVRINRSPGEELDGPRQFTTRENAIFDVMSGPEVYNPNVDPETAVNWPGALPGTKQVRLPKELQDAVQQANFAVDVLSKITQVTSDDDESGEVSYFQLGDKNLTKQQVEGLQSVANEAIQIGLIANPLDFMSERSRLDMILNEMWDQPQERYREIASNYKDLLLSDNFVALVKERLQQMVERDLDAMRRQRGDLDNKDDSNNNDNNKDASVLLQEEKHQRERDILGHLVSYAQLLLKEARALGAELEAQQLEVIRSICNVAMDPTHVTEEETATALTDAVRDMRPLLDDAFVAYLKYAVAEEEGRLARAGLLDDPDHNQWLFVLKIVQQGVYTEIARGINRYLEHIWYVLRMKTKTERRLLLEQLIDVMPTMDVRPFVQVVDNICGALGESARGEFDKRSSMVLGEMTNQLLQLHRDVKELLPPDRIDRMSRDADEWAAKQKQRLVEHRKMTKQRLKAARETEHLDDEIEALGRRGEMERMT